MLTAEQKKIFLEGWISLVGSARETKELNSSLYQLLLDDTNMSGKLYKYRSFDKKRRSLKSLKTGTLYCAPPDSFNDPFDCKIGVTLTSLAQVVIGPIFEVANEIAEILPSILSGDRSIASCSKDEQQILNKLLASKELVAFLEENRTEEISDLQIATLIKAQPNIFVQLIHAVIADEFFSSMLGPATKMIPHILESITTEGMVTLLTKEPTYEVMAQAMGIEADADEINLSLRIGEKLFPELQAERDQTRAILDDLERRVISKTNTLFRVGCLCTDYRNALMWSHYADCHKGFCVEYDFSAIDDSNTTGLPMPVVYSDVRPQFPWENAIVRSAESTARATAHLMVGVLTKDKRWEYENEWRFLIPATMSPNLSMPPISCIYLGAKIAPKNRKKILMLAKKLGTPVKQMVVDRGAYTLHPEDIQE